MDSDWDAVAGYNISKLDPDVPGALTRPEQRKCGLYFDTEDLPRQRLESRTVNVNYSERPIARDITSFDAAVEYVQCAIQQRRGIYQCSYESDETITEWILHMELTMLALLKRAHETMKNPPAEYIFLGGLHSPFVEEFSHTFAYSYALRDTPHGQYLARCYGVI